MMPKLATNPNKPALPVKTRALETAADRRAYLRRMAGWPPLREKE